MYSHIFHDYLKFPKNNQTKQVKTVIFVLDNKLYI